MFAFRKKFDFVELKKKIIMKSLWNFFRTLNLYLQICKPKNHDTKGVWIMKNAGFESSRIFLD